MKRFVLTAVLGWPVCLMSGAQSPVTFTLTIENPSAHARTAQPVVVNLADRAEWFGYLKRWEEACAQPCRITVSVMP